MNKKGFPRPRLTSEEAGCAESVIDELIQTPVDTVVLECLAVANQIKQLLLFFFRVNYRVKVLIGREQLAEREDGVIRLRDSLNLRDHTAADLNILTEEIVF